MSRNSTYLIISAIVLVIAIGGYFIYKNNYQPSTTQGQQNAPAVTETTSVAIKSFAFSPQDIKVKKGDTVTWKNEDAATHTIKSDSFQSGDISTGGTYQHKFENAGTFNYSCSIHPSMTGTVTVE